MNIKVNIATKEIELLDSVPFEDVKKLVNMFIAGYGWDEKEVRIKSKAELMPYGTVITYTAMNT